MKKLIFIIFLFLPVFVFSQANQANQGSNINVNKMKLNGFIYSDKSGEIDTLIVVNSDSTAYRYLNVADPVDSMDAVNLSYFLRNAAGKDSTFITITADTLFIGGDTIINADFLMSETLFIADSANILHYPDTLINIATKYDVALKQDLILNLADSLKYLKAINFWDSLFANQDEIIITESQISDLDHFTTADEVDGIYSAWDKSTGISIAATQVTDFDTEVENNSAVAANTGKDTTGIYHVNRYILNAIESAYKDADSTKLAGIESGATADQTGSEIEGLLDTELGNTDWKKAVGIITGTVAAGDDLRFHDSTFVSGESYLTQDGQNVIAGKIYPANADSTAWIALITANSGSASNTKTITQATHGFSVGDWIKNNGTIYTLAQGNSAANADVIGVVSDSTDENTFTYQFGGILTSGTWVKGSSYFLSVATAGLAETGISYAPGNIRVFLGTGVDGGLLLEIDVGIEIAASTTGVDSLIAGNLVNLSAGEGDVTVSVNLSKLADDATATVNDSIPWIDDATGQKKMKIDVLKTLVADGTGTDAQDLSSGGKTGNMQTVNISGGDAVTFSVADADSSVTNEIQALTIAGTTSPTIALSGSNTATFAGAGIVTLNQNAGTITITGTEVDGSTTNELDNATHTGDVTGATALTIAPDSVNDTHINFGTGTNQVSTTDLPEGTNLYYKENAIKNNIDTFRCNATIAINDVCILGSSGMVLVDADAEATTKGLVAVALETASAGNTGKLFLLSGIVTTTGLTMGNTWYISPTAGGKTTTAPSTTGQFVRVLGESKNTTQFYFHPDNSWTKVK